MPTIDSFHAIEILDSRGRPTLQVTCQLADGVKASASVPSGASTGKAEALELRDGDRNRYRGLGCRSAVSHVESLITSHLANAECQTQRQLDEALLELDGTTNKSRLGANAILGCSLAFCRAVAKSIGVPFYQHVAEQFDLQPRRLPRLSINLFSGGKHAGGQVAIQDVLVVPIADSVTESLEMTYEVYQTAADICRERYGMRLLTADEGGLAPPCTNCDQMFELAVEAIAKAGLTDRIQLAVDVASSHFESDGTYTLDGQDRTGTEMIDLLSHWVTSYPIVSMEDGLAEEDWQNWTSFVGRHGEDVRVVGDDLLCTNPGRIRRAVAEKAANTLLLKVNQIGTLTEAAEARRLAVEAGWQVVISARSGETEDNWLADLAVGWSGDFIKVGSISQSERLAKYNRLLEIEQETGWKIEGSV